MPGDTILHMCNKNYDQMMSSFCNMVCSLRHMRHSIPRPYLCKHPKHQTQAKKKSTLHQIKKASRCVVDHKFKTATFFMFHFLQKTKIIQENCVCFFIGSVVKIALYLHFLYTKDERLQQIKRNMNNGKIIFLTSCFPFPSDKRYVIF